MRLRPIPALLAALLAATASASSVDSIQGTWIVEDNSRHAQLTIDGDGTFLLGEYGSDVGVAKGTLSASPNGDSYGLTTSLDQLGGHGLFGDGQSASFTLEQDGSLLVQATKAGNALSTVLTRVVNNAANLVGTWGVQGTSTGRQHFTFFADGRYLMVDPIGDELAKGNPCGGPGIEYGTYSYTGSTLAALSTTLDTNGCAGMNDTVNPANNSPMPISVGPDGYNGIVVSPDGTSYFYRLSSPPPVTPLPGLALSSDDLLAQVTGSTGKMTLNVQLTIPPAATPKTYGVYVVAYLPAGVLGLSASTFFIKAADGSWSALSANLPVYLGNVAVGANATTVNLEVLKDFDFSAVKGTEFYAGYGESAADMLNNARYRPFYKVQ